MLDRSPKIMCVKSELLTLSIKQAMGQNIKKNIQNLEIPTKTIIRVGMSNFIKFDLRWDPKWMCY